MVIVAREGVLTIVDVATGHQTSVGGAGGPFREAAWSPLLP